MNIATKGTLAVAPKSKRQRYDHPALAFLASCLLLLVATSPSSALCPVKGCEGAVVPASETGDPWDTDPGNLEAALSAAGYNGSVQLCPGKTFSLPRKVTFPVGNVKLTTCNPNGTANRAILQVTGRTASTSDATAIFIRKPSVTLDYLEIRGGGPWSPYSGLPHDNRDALVEAGGNNGSGLTVSNCILREPQGWSALHAFEGSIDSWGNPACRNVMIRDNQIFNAGYPTKISGYSRWADGVSMACAGTVTRNLIVNPSDGGVVVFTPDVVVTHNTVQVVGFGRHSFGGVNLVDCISKGNMTGIEVGHNRFQVMYYGTMDMAVAVGPTVWNCNYCRHNDVSYSDYDMTGSSIHHNHVDIYRGGSFKYGFVISRVHGLETRWNDYDLYLTGFPDSCSGRLLPPNRGAIIATEDLSRNTLEEGVGFWDPSYGRDRFYHLIEQQ